jgi:hypothetical protein
MDLNTIAVIVITSCIISIIYIFIFTKFLTKGKDGKDGTCPQNCVNGKDGKDGEPGTCPQQCVNGSMGPTGPTGPTGLTGPTGPQGPKFDIGKEICIGNTCIDENNLKKLVNNTFPGLKINGDLEMNNTSGYPIRITPGSGATSSLITFHPKKSFGLDANWKPWADSGWYNEN